MKVLKDSISIYQLSKECPQTKDIMKNLGFEDIVKPGMLQTAGRFMTLKKGCEFKKVDYTIAKSAFNEVGIDFEEEN
ncbi:MAG: DUF1858 domain-containing protein [Candidatus Izemoplasmatales bacterium]|uniref:DUF1858 domain-containing protein n=1 Tax=Hujiaoplasma nucleasis TaxID=2725268 RepID=A0A7L6N5Q8_9MOLU|nr:DUF1858 domain-containing protein [Hujiaoplasma nucleasis]QLY40832.1 DUF1858 domain-containing protein [Hujiaoplasma nucleasis]